MSGYFGTKDVNFQQQQAGVINILIISQFFLHSHLMNIPEKVLSFLFQ